MKISGFTIITVLFSVLAHNLASITTTEGAITRITEDDWTDKIPAHSFGGLSSSSGPHQAQGEFSKKVGPGSTSFLLSNGEKDQQVRIFNASDHDQEYMLEDLSPQNRLLCKNIQPKETHVVDLLGSQFSFYLYNLPSYF